MSVFPDCQSFCTIADEKLRCPAFPSIQYQMYYFTKTDLIVRNTVFRVVQLQTPRQGSCAYRQQPQLIFTTKYFFDNLSLISFIIF